MFRLLITVSLALSFQLQASVKEDLSIQVKQNHTVRNLSYKEVRKYLFGLLHFNNGIVRDVYCEQEFDSRSGVGDMQIPNSNLINCEHTWPQSKFTNNHSKSVQKVDLHHLYPSNSRSNSVRSNHPFGEVSGGELRGCKASKYSEKTFEPADNHKGNVARAMFYFSVRYDVKIDAKQESYFRKWNIEDPVDMEEIIRNELIRGIQGNSNVFIEHPHLISEIKDF